MSWCEPTQHCELQTLNFVQKLPISLESFTDNRLMLTYQILGHNNQGIVCLITQSNFVFRTQNFPWMSLRTTDIQWRHKSKISEKLGRCGRQNMLRPYLKIWDWDWIFGHAVKTFSSLGVLSPWMSRREPTHNTMTFISKKLRALCQSWNWVNVDSCCSTSCTNFCCVISEWFSYWTLLVKLACCKSILNKIE